MLDDFFWLLVDYSFRFHPKHLTNNRMRYVEEQWRAQINSMGGIKLKK